MGLNPCSIGILSFNSEIGNDLDLRKNIVKRVKKEFIHVKKIDSVKNCSLRLFKRNAIT
jgi:hypothetical protein